MTLKYIVYTRVSTEEQGRSGLGLEAQLAACSNFAGDAILATFTDVESGKAAAHRPEFEKALQLAKKSGAMILVAKLDRLSRSVATIATIMEKGEIDFRVVDMPTANRVTIHIMAAIAEEERHMISARTKAGLAAAKARGVKLGGSRGDDLTAARAARTRAADKRAREHLPVIQALTESGHSSRQIAQRLNAMGLKTVRGAQWTGTQVLRILGRAGA